MRLKFSRSFSPFSIIIIMIQDSNQQQSNLNYIQAHSINLIIRLIKRIDLYQDENYCNEMLEYLIVWKQCRTHRRQGEEIKLICQGQIQSLQSLDANKLINIFAKMCTKGFILQLQINFLSFLFQKINITLQIYKAAIEFLEIVRDSMMVGSKRIFQIIIQFGRLQLSHQSNSPLEKSLWGLVLKCFKIIQNVPLKEIKIMWKSIIIETKQIVGLKLLCFFLLRDKKNLLFISSSGFLRDLFINLFENNLKYQALSLIYCGDFKSNKQISSLNFQAFISKKDVQRLFSKENQISSYYYQQKSNQYVQQQKEIAPSLQNEKITTLQQFLLSIKTCPLSKGHELYKRAIFVLPKQNIKDFLLSFNKKFGGQIGVKKIYEEEKVRMNFPKLWSQIQ